MNQLAAKYRDRGLVILALQVRRDRDVLAENVIYWLESIRPTIPVFRLGWNPEWPARTLPFAFLFDHEGRAVFAGNLGRLERAIVKALDAAPDPVIGGPYEKRKALAASIVADRDNLGTHVARLRAMEDPDPELRAMIGAAERWFERRAARIEEHMPGVVERAEAWDALARTFAGDGLGERAAKERDALRSTTTFAAEKAAEMALRRARVTFRRCPPRGGYFPYHFTRMNYTVIDDPAWVATRVRMHVEFRIELDRIVAAHPDTHAAEEAVELLFVHDVPEFPIGAARERVERAQRMLSAGARPAELYEAWLLLVEVRDGYLGSDEVSTRADELLSSLRKDRPKELTAAETEARALREETDLLRAKAQRGGSLLSRRKADEIMARLKDIAKRSGGDTVLARRIAAYVAELAESFEGTPRVGIRLDFQFPGPGVRIARVDSGTGAAKVGLVSGDVILKIGETALAGLDDISKALVGKKPGETVEFEVRRAPGVVEVLDLPLGRSLRTRQRRFPR